MLCGLLCGLVSVLPAWLPRVGARIGASVSTRVRPRLRHAATCSCTHARPVHVVTSEDLAAGREKRDGLFAICTDYF